MKKTVTTLADGRELIYYDTRGDTVRTAVDPRPLTPVDSRSEIRLDALTGDHVAIASHRQARTYHPPADACPLCPARDGRESEIPEQSYEVAVFENRFPSLSGGVGRCEVVCFTDDHTQSFADLTEERVSLVLDAWTDRTGALSALPGVEQVYCFENRGAEIGVTLPHAHGQIYAFPYVTPRTAAMRRRIDEHRAETGRNLFDDVVDRERADGDRVVLETEHWIAFVPYAAHWPYEVHLHPKRRVPDLLALDGAARTECAQVYLELLRRFDRIFGPDEPPTPYIAAWHQAPFTDARREDFGLHLELFTVRRASGKLKFLAGTESGMDAFMNDVRPEDAARRIREVASA
ncbi:MULTISPECIES: galactose-1-phosphate uridylyltransferase [Streptomyces]|uniref:Galactose-1-phosphate uridylyltransferase n=4 Tax=Streptomyces venezuelae TaxID=54571 RepID=F2R7G1_STRVP|nr:galactose-1-phosphate uridylyltransferase [Streptomyces venezuelae]APE22121.1 galactose-1-phosphate uridylyltransferase [Streptomyces venezuelae]QER99507.1 galactose-1-phosphate uridylyltransferase [Streptomyces venezuelae ATCC 10712]CCA56246.1 Galactose-1-phosphate uridylyltransferase [Streptomyces venezuelae ATCC 10712]